MAPLLFFVRAPSVIKLASRRTFDYFSLKEKGGKAMKRKLFIFLTLVAALTAAIGVNGCSSKKAPAENASPKADSSGVVAETPQPAAQNAAGKPVQYDFKKDLFLISKPMGLSNDFLTGFLDHNYATPQHQSVDKKHGRLQHTYVYRYYYNVWILLVKTEEGRATGAKKGLTTSYSEVINAYANDSTYAIIKNNLLKSNFQFTKEKDFDKYLLKSIRIECRPHKSGYPWLDEQFKKTPVRLQILPN
jgi:hypothetical protein